MNRERAIFLDRDGTLIEDVHYLSHLSQIRWIPGAVDGLRLLKNHGYRLVVVTNQSGVARGLFNEEFVELVHRTLAEELAAQGVEVDGWYYCPHHPMEGRPPFRRECNCRKPRPGLILEAAKALNIDLSSSFVIGDTLRDMEAGRKSGATPILVQTGKGGKQQEEIAKDHRFNRIPIFPSLWDAASWICRQHR